MKLILAAFVFFIATSCNAKDASTQPVANNCQYTRANLAIKAPADSSVVNSYWQKDTDKDSQESIDRLHLVFTDGSSAVIEYKYCSMYNFSVVYYARSVDAIDNEKKVAAIVDRLVGYSPVKVSFNKPFRQIVESALKSKGYNGQAKLQAYLSPDDVDTSDGIEYKISYSPLEERGVAEGVVGFYMGIGGEQ